MKPKDRIPTIEEYYEMQLQLRPVVSESQRNWNRSRAEHHSALRAEIIDLIGNRVCKPTTTVH